MGRKKLVIMGAAGRDFHNFNVLYRDNRAFEVVAFTAAQIPNIERRTYPASLAGHLYPDGIPIHSEEALETLVRDNAVDAVVFSYSDISHMDVMHKASLANAAGADFVLVAPSATMLKSKVPVVAICAVRTGAGKSQTTRRVAEILLKKGRRLVVVRHPMPYGDLEAQAVQRFETYEDLDRYDCTIEEREEYEPHLRNGIIVYAGVDYEAILRKAETEADIILWEGGNNDTPFFVPDIHIVLLDPHRAGHEVAYHPGETNLRMADVFIVNKVSTADPDDVEAVKRRAREANPDAVIIDAESPITVESPEAIRGKRVLVVEDGPTLTHGGMSFGAGTLAAESEGAAEIVDPRPYAVGSIKEVFENYPQDRNLLPAMGYGEEQVAELEQTINAVDCDVVVSGTPVDLNRILNVNKPLLSVRYELREMGRPNLEDILSSL